MLQFELTLSETEIWSLVAFIKNYKPGGEQLLVELPPVKARMSALYTDNESKVRIEAEYMEESGEFLKLGETPVIISVERAFGNLKVGQAVTNEDGIAEFSVPVQIIRDDKGLLTLVTSLGDDYEAEEVVLTGSVSGTPKPMPEILEEGVLYSTNDRIPFWLLLAYIGVVGGVWLAIAYVVILIIRIKKYSKS